MLGEELSYLAGAEMGKEEQDVPWGVEVEAVQLGGHPPALPTGVGCTCAYGVCWSCWEGLDMGRMRRMGLGCGVSLGEQNPVGGGDGGADLSPT